MSIEVIFGRFKWLYDVMLFPEADIGTAGIDEYTPWQCI
jgi:hypothetical protein